MFIKRNKKYIIALVLSAVLFLGFSILFYKPQKETSFVPENKNYQEQTIKPQTEIPLKLNKEKEVIKTEELQDESIGIPASLIIGENKYEVTTKEGSTVFETMEKIAKENKNFSFKYTEHPSLGNFVTEINGVKGSPGEYWIYYLNDKKATIGVSNLILKSGDIIRWNQEGM